LSLSLVAIEKESAIAGDLLRLLCFLGPDQITKPLLRHLVGAKNKVDQGTRDIDISKDRNSTGMTLLMTCCLVLSGTVLMTNGKGGHRTGLFAVLSLSVASALAFTESTRKRAALDGKEESSHLTRSSSIGNSFTGFEYEQTDVVWDILKSFSLLSVKEGKGSMHRLLAQALRASQSTTESHLNLRICVDAMCSVWTFQPGHTESWKESLLVLEHVKSVVSHSRDGGFGPMYTLKIGQLSTEAGVFSAMALNAFPEAQASIELALKLLGNSKEANKPPFRKARGVALHELGRILRYQGTYEDAERSLLNSLAIFKGLNRREESVIQGVADALHELGVLEVKKHNLDSATSFLQQSLDMRKSSDFTCSSDSTNADCAATLHQLAAVYVARKPPQLEKAKALLQEALGLSRQIGQRAATLKQLARVTIRQGLLDRAETYLEQALELYLELYGDNKLHINIAAVKFQQGALALQREQWDQAWPHFSECLRVRRHVYAYARPVGSTSTAADPTHLEVSCVLHELGRVALAQERFTQSFEMLKSECRILERLEETTTQSERLHQARLTNLTWLRKCAKSMGDEEEAAQLAQERSALKKRAGEKLRENLNPCEPDSLKLQHTAMHCRLLARKLALQKERKSFEQAELLSSLGELLEEINKSPAGSMKRAAMQFRYTVLMWIDKSIDFRRSPLLQACDRLRQVRNQITCLKRLCLSHYLSIISPTLSETRYGLRVSR
jgi:tetratricopeptide (TPR) repeat protein